MTSDEPDIEAGLERCPPPCPQQLNADSRGDRVELRWTPARSAVGALSYRAVRVSAAGRVLLCEVTDSPSTQATDATPPLDEEISYEVTTVRGGRVESAPTASPPIRVVPEIEDLAVFSDRDGVAGSWRLPKRAVAIRVVRTEALLDHGPGQEIVTSADGAASVTLMCWVIAPLSTGCSAVIAHPRESSSGHRARRRPSMSSGGRNQ